MTQKRFLRTKFFTALVVSVVVIASVFWLPRPLTDPIRKSILLVAFPFEKAFSVAAFETADTFRFFSSIGNLKNENERLEKERLRLSAENARLIDIGKENEELRSELGLLPREQYELKAASVIGRDAGGLGNWLSIDQGALQGIVSGMPVIVDAGILVGRVSDVSASSSRVMLLSNPESIVNGSETGTEASGIVKGEHGLGLLFDMVLQTDVLKEGDSVVTSGLGGVFPKGLLIGTIQEPRFSEDRLFQQASLVSPIEIDRLRYVFVITNTRMP